MPTLNWLGKDKIINHDKHIPIHALNKIYNFGGATQNKIIHGDNLLALKSLLPLYEGKIKCVYIDPPYNTGKDFNYDDEFSHDKWLCMMYPRLKLLKKLLSNDGAIFISIDDNEVANLKLICDEIFGSQNFIAQFAWKRKKQIANDSRNVSTQGEYIICYSKSFDTVLNRESLSAEAIKKYYRPPTENFPLDYWCPVPITVSKGLSGGGYEYEIKTPSGAVHKKIWAYPQHRYEELLRNGRIYFGKSGSAIPQRIIYLLENTGKPTSNFWDNVATNSEGKKEILNIFGDNLFQTPKPTRLIEKILRLATDKNSIVLDSFAGSGTTAHAVINLNREDGGNRKFILIEMEDYAENITAERVKRVGGSFDFYEIDCREFYDDKKN